MARARASKQEIVKSLQAHARRLGKTPSRQAFLDHSDCSLSDINYYWTSWNKAVLDAGLPPNEKQKAKPVSEVTEDFLLAVRHFNQIPTTQMLKILSRERRSEGLNFTAHNTFNRLGASKAERIGHALSHARQSNAWDDIIPILEASKFEASTGNIDEFQKDVSFGFVYLITKHGGTGHYKIGKSTDSQTRIGNLQTGSSTLLQLVHEIKTDDMHGVEGYWHNRFENKLQRGEWYKLTGEDVNAFKRWKRIY